MSRGNSTYIHPNTSLLPRCPVSAETAGGRGHRPPRGSSCREAHSLSPSRSGGAGGTTSCQYDHPAERVCLVPCAEDLRVSSVAVAGLPPSSPGEGRALGAADAGGNVTRSIPLCLDLGLQNGHMRLCPDPTPSANTNPVLARLPFLSSVPLMSARHVPCSALNYLRGSAVTAH